MVVKNSCSSIKKYLKQMYKEVSEVTHVGNYVFEANTDLGLVKVFTKPVNEEEDKIKIYGIRGRYYETI
jgi:hypothetical protein